MPNPVAPTTTARFRVEPSGEGFAVISPGGRQERLWRDRLDPGSARADAELDAFLCNDRAETAASFLGIPVGQFLETLAVADQAVPAAPGSGWDAR